MKQLLALLLAALLCLSAGCGAADDEGDYDAQAYEEDARQLTEATTYYNDLLGLRYTVPSGWWLYEVNSDNFSTTQGTTGDELSLDVLRGEGLAYLPMISFANLQYSNRDNHISIQIDAERTDTADSLAAYAQEYTDYMLEPVEDLEDYELLESWEADIGGVPCWRIVFLVPQEDQADYCIMSLLFDTGTGYYLGIHANYWADNEGAVDSILQSIEGSLAFS